MDLSLLFIGIIILIALAFDFTNGMHDAANSISTIVSTRVLTPKQAIVWAALFNFVAFLVFGTGVAETIGKGMVDVTAVTPTVILAGVCGAICWNLITWYFGLPSSSCHALIGRYAGAAITKSGLGVIIAGGWYKTLTFIIFMPAMLFSGFIFPIYAMPEIVKLITYLNPLRYFIEVVRMVVLKGSGIGDITTHLAIISVFAIIINAFAIWRYRKTS